MFLKYIFMLSLIKYSLNWRTVLCIEVRLWNGNSFYIKCHFHQTNYIHFLDLSPVFDLNPLLLALPQHKIKINSYLL